MEQNLEGFREGAVNPVGAGFQAGKQEPTRSSKRGASVRASSRGKAGGRRTAGQKL